MPNIKELIIDNYFRKINKLKVDEDTKTELRGMLISFQNDVTQDIKSSVLKELQKQIEKLK